MNEKDRLVYFFGYGSLMYPDGINSRGMDHYYEKSDLQPCRLMGYVRGPFVCHNNKHYYSIARYSASRVNGVVFKIHTADDLLTLLRDEMSSREYKDLPGGQMYDVTEVTKDIFDVWLPQGAEVWALTHPVHRGFAQGFMEQWYMEHIWKGIQVWGKDFCDEFLRTGGQLPGGIKNERSQNK